jgi:hypothetical protein
MSKEDENDLTEIFGSPISVYTSEMAEADGILIKTDNKIINYITQTVFERCIAPFIEPLAMTRLSLANKPLEITDADRKKAEKELVKRLIESAILEVQKLNRNDWFYALNDCRGWKDMWVVQNETGLWTLMFSSDY